MKKISFLFGCFMMCCLGTAFSQYYSSDYLRIGDVRNSWYTQPGSIDSATIDVTPKGLYAACDMYLYFSTNGTSYYSSDSLEIQMAFTLPAEAVVTGLYLWINDSAIKADIMDRWTASQIYEEIVSRRTDPALLLKNGATNYSLNIFPLMTNMPRKIKISYLLPLSNLNSGNVSLSLPLNIFKLSNLQVNKVNINYHNAQNLTNPKLLDNDNVTFATINDQSSQFEQATITNVKDLTSLELSLSNTIVNPVFSGTYTPQGSSFSFYEMEFKPSDIFTINEPRKALFMFDYLPTGQDDAEIVLNTLKNTIIKNLTSKDSFNVVFSGASTHFASNKWVAGDSTHIADLFASINKKSFKGYTALPSVLIDGIEFIKENGKNGSIVLIANSYSNGTYQQANSLIKDYLSAIGKDTIPVHVIDLDVSYNGGTYIGGQYYYGNQYLYKNLCRLTVGSYATVRDQNYYYYDYYSNSYSNFLTNGAYSKILTDAFTQLGGYFTSMDIYVSTTGGYTYSNYKLNSTNGIYFYHQPFRQVGKFVGNTPFRIIASAQLNNGEVVSKELNVNTNIISLDSTARTIWANGLIKEMMAQTNTNQSIDQIIAASIDESILTNYTAFIALEPGTVIPDPEDPNKYTDGEINIGIKNDPEIASKVSITAFPNPFSSSTTITLDLMEMSDVLVEVYSIDGRKVTTIASGSMNKGQHKLTFNGEDLQAGVYYCKVLINGKTESTLKLVIMR